MTRADMELVREYAASQSEQAFETLVSRHINLVYSTSVRQVRDPHLAEEITQAVFIILARKADKLGPGTILPSWLHRTACYAAADALRSQRRRQQREQEAYVQSLLNEPEVEHELWRQIAPLVDEAISKLGQRDRDAIVLRFFENKTIREVGTAIGASEDAAKMRVNRALEKLRKFFTKRGVVSTTAIIAGAMAANSIQAAPATLAKPVTAAAIAKGVAASSSSLTLIHGALKLMAWSKAKMGIAIGIGVLLTTGVSLPLLQYNFGTDSWKHRFDSTYKLKPSEIVKFIPSPFISARAEFYQTDRGLHMQYLAIPKGPDAFVFKQTEQERPTFSACTFGAGGKRPLIDSMELGMGFKKYEFEDPQKLLDVKVTGDWTLREGKSREEILAAMEPILFKVTKHHIHFEKQMMDREVLVASGTVRLDGGNDPDKKVEVYAEKKGPYEANGGAGLERMLSVLGGYLNIPVVNEAQSSDMFQWRIYPDVISTVAGRRKQEFAEKALRNLTTQTGLSFTHQTRPQEVWVVSERP